MAGFIYSNMLYFKNVENVNKEQQLSFFFKINLLSIMSVEIVKAHYNLLLIV